VNQQTWFGSVHHYRVLQNCYAQSIFQNTLAFVFMRLHWWIISRCLADFGLMPSLTWRLRTAVPISQKGSQTSCCRVFSRRCTVNSAYCKTQESAWCFSPRMRALPGRQIAGFWPAPRKELFLLQEKWLETRIPFLNMTPLIVNLQRRDPTCALFF